MSARIMAEARRQQEEVEAEGDPLRQATAASGGRWETTFQLWGFRPRCSAVPRRITILTGVADPAAAGSLPDKHGVPGHSS